MPDANERFGVLVFEYLKTMVPYWRLCDEAWLLGDEQHLIGIGVLRNYGGQAMVVPLTEGVLPHPKWPAIATDLRSKGIALSRVVVVADDRDGSYEWQHSTGFTEVLWSERERLKAFVIKDQP